MRARGAVLGLLILVACGKDAAKTALPGPTTTASSVATTTSPATTATTRAAGTPLTTAPRGTCALAPVGAGATNVATKFGDFDGNHTADTLRAYKLGTDWHLRVELNGGTTGGDTVVPDVDQGSVLKPIGGFDIGGNAGDEAFAVVGNGAATTILGLFVFDGCKLTRVTENGSPAPLVVGASALHRSGVSCVLGTALQKLTGTAAPTGTPFTIVRATYDLSGSTLVLANTSQVTLAADDPAAAASATLDCGRLSLN